MMTALLERAFEHAMVLPEALQDDIAEQWLQELEWELNWDATFAASQPLLEQFALKALQDDAAGRAVEMGFDEL